ncbi:SRPBCC domain-containing protein [Saccharopolyspora hirsuta]|nr:SRPBCC domain-containing protein [Saccharopolyspora hirsuta]
MGPATAMGWHGCLAALADVVAEHPVEHPGGSQELHERLVRDFGLDRGTSESTSDGWRVRFDRPLFRQPVDAVWRTLTESGEPGAGGAVPTAFDAKHVPAGQVISAEPPRRLEYDWTADGISVGRVRWELADGAGGARIVLTQTGPAELSDQREAALDAWQQHLEALVVRLHG